jgi:hypothetical protein
MPTASDISPRSARIEAFTPYTILDMRAVFDRVCADREQGFSIAQAHRAVDFASTIAGLTQKHSFCVRRLVTARSRPYRSGSLSHTSSNIEYRTPRSLKRSNSRRGTDGKGDDIQSGQHNNSQGKDG